MTAITGPDHNDVQTGSELGLTSLTDPVGSTTSWVYDGLNRVTTETN